MVAVKDETVLKEGDVPHRSIGMKGFACGYGAWLILSFGLDVAQLGTTTLCVYANGREWGPESRWYVQDENDGDDGNSKSGYWATKLDDDKWFADDAEKVDENGNPVAAKTRKSYWDEADQGTPLIQTPQGWFLIFVTLLGLGGNVVNLAGISTPSYTSTLLYFVSMFETMDQYFILNLTCSSLIDGASFIVSAVGLIVSSCFLYFKCKLEIEHSLEKPSDAELSAKASSAQNWKWVYLIAGFGAWCASFVVGAYAANIYPSGSLEFVMGVIAIICCILVAVGLYFFGETTAKALLELTKAVGKIQKARTVEGQMEMGAAVLGGGI